MKLLVILSFSQVRAQKDTDIKAIWPVRVGFGLIDPAELEG
jgi:hypothetical protein